MTEQQNIEGQIAETTEKESLLRLQQTMSRADFSALRAHYMYKMHPHRMRNLIIAFLIFAALTAVAKMADLSSSLYLAGVCGVCILTFVFVWIDAQARKLEKPGKSIGNRTQTIVFTEDSFHVEWLNYGVPLEYKWDKVLVCGEGEHHYFLYVAKLAAIVIPKRGIKSEKLKELDELLKTKTTFMAYQAKEKHIG